MQKILITALFTVFLGLTTIAEAKDSDHSNWLKKEIAEIQEDYDEAVTKIDKSPFDSQQKSILKKQAESNKQLAIEQAQARKAQFEKNSAQRNSFLTDENASKVDKKARKLFKKIDNIL